MIDIYISKTPARRQSSVFPEPPAFLNSKHLSDALDYSLWRAFPAGPDIHFFVICEPGDNSQVGGSRQEAAVDTTGC